MKKLILFLSAMLMTLTANAQFKEGKGYLGASLTGFNTNWNSKHGFNIGAEAKAGFFFTDDWMLLAQAGFQHNGKETSPTISKPDSASATTLSRTVFIWDSTANTFTTTTATTT